MTFSSLPVIGPKAAADVRAFLDTREPPRVERKTIQQLIALLGTALPRRRTSSMEANAMIEQYWLGLQDLPHDSIAHAHLVILCEDEWFPTVKRIREAASTSPAARDTARRNAAKSLLMKHRQEYQAPIAPDELCTPDEARAVLDEVGITFATQPDYSNLREPSMAELAALKRELDAETRGVA